jgi:uncharacterized membrane protein YidH (DUF202 family)
VNDDNTNGDRARDPIGDDQDERVLSAARTDLAWSRSGLAFVVCIAAMAKRFAPDLETLDASAIVTLGLVVGGIAWGFSLFWARAVAGVTLSGRPLANDRKLWFIAVGTAGIGCAALVVAMLPDH